VKSLRLEKHWSQEQLAQLSGLNVRTIQRLEKGESVGIETLKSLAAVFEVSTEELIDIIENEKRDKVKDQEDSLNSEIETNKAKEKVKSIRQFYASTAFLVGIFLLFMLPNYNNGENLGPLIAVLVSFIVLIVGHAIVVFQPFGEEWEKKKVSQIVKKNEENKH
jgi:transcriptional regulator with XRE-family HTH domain